MINDGFTIVAFAMEVIGIILFSVVIGYGMGKQTILDSCDMYGAYITSDVRYTCERTD